MQIYLVKTLIGIFAIDERRNVVSFKPFPRSPSEAARKFLQITPEELTQLEKEFKQVVESSPELEEFVKNNLRKFAVEHRFVRDQMEFNQFLTRINSELAKKEIKASTNRDNLIIHANNAIDEIEKSINI